MAINLTQNQLVLLLTENLPACDRIEMHAQINNDWVLKESYRDLKKAYSALVKVIKKPSPASLKSILNYSQNSMNHARV